MIEFSWQFFAVGIPAIIFGGISKGGFGSGAAFVAGAILALVVPPGAALGIVLPLFMLVDAATLKPYWGKWHWPSAKGLMIGAVPGCIIAAYLYAIVDADIFANVGFRSWQIVGFGAGKSASELASRLRSWQYLILARRTFF